MPKSEWVVIAEAEVGVSEKRGGESPRILEYHASTSLKAREDEIPWCASFVNWCLREAGLKGTGSAAAISFAAWGDRLTTPREGCITVIRQRKKGQDQATGSSSGNHVAFFQKIQDGRIYLLGGNQGDQVKVSSFGLSSYDVIAYRWPSAADESA
jgi:uncharacterized protein (TIGR02594 family)